MPDLEPQPKGLIQKINSTLPQGQTESVPKDKEPESVKMAKAILSETKLSQIASYWSGLPANREYYDEDELRKMYEMVSSQAGEVAACSFANMVLDMLALAPSNLIRAFISLAYNNWIYDSQFSEHILAGKTDVRPVKKGGVENVYDAAAEGFFGCIAVATVDKKDETEKIKQGFRDILGDELMKTIKISRDVLEQKPYID